jgi:hypothetical protein
MEANQIEILPPEWRERYEERVSIIMEGCRLSGTAGLERAQFAAYEDVRRQMLEEF